MKSTFGVIRRKLVEQENLRKYLLYAIGEVLLIVLGILIAFQVDEWNNQRKINKKVQVALHSLNSELVNDSLAIHELADRVNKNLLQNHTLLERITKESATPDTLLNIARHELEISWVAHINYSSSTFENLTSTGTFEFFPDSVKFALTNYYSAQKYYTNIVEMSNNQYRQRLDEFMKSYMIHAPKNPDYSSTHINRLIWNEVNPKHLAIQLHGLLVTRESLYVNYLHELNIIQEKTRSLIRTIKPLFK